MPKTQVLIDILTHFKIVFIFIALVISKALLSRKLQINPPQIVNSTRREPRFKFVLSFHSSRQNFMKSCLWILGAIAITLSIINIDLFNHQCCVPSNHHNKTEQKKNIHKILYNPCIHCSQCRHSRGYSNNLFICLISVVVWGGRWGEGLTAVNAYIS